MRSIVRAVVAALFILGLTASFLGLLALPVAYVEFIPSLLAFDTAIVAAILVATALFGRVYCAVLCPLGIFQDVVFWFKKRLRRKAVCFHYEGEYFRLRYGVLFVLFVSWLAGLAFIPVLVDPYSIYGRMVTNLVSPWWQQGFNALVGLGEAQGWFLWEKYDLVFQGLATLAVSAVYFFIVAVLAWRYGRLYCNAFCPVGTMLGTVSRFSFFKIKFDSNACISCGLCERQCRSACIDVVQHRVDSSRCVMCLDCIDQCPKGALSFGHQRLTAPAAAEPASPAAPVLSRRAMLVSAGIAVGTAAAGIARAAQDFSVLPVSAGPLPVMPPGSGTPQQFLQQCTACHLCIDRCPSQVLRPAEGAYGLAGIGKPLADYSRGYCDYNCNVCGSVCPTGAIRHLPLKVKQGTVMGIARCDSHQCLVMSEGVECGNCAIHCPAGAITMEAVNGVRLPHVTEYKCIGCGSCEYHCPAAPKAIKVLGKGSGSPSGAWQ